MAEVSNEQLTQGSVVIAQVDSLIDHPRGLELPMRHVEVNRLPGRSGQGGDLGHQGRRTPSQSDEGDLPVVVELREVRVGRQLGVEHQMSGAFAVALLPALYATKDLVSLLTVADVGVGVAEEIAFGVPCKESENRLAPLTTPRNVMLFDEWVVPEV